MGDHEEETPEGETQIKKPTQDEIDMYNFDPEFPTEYPEYNYTDISPALSACPSESPLREERALAPVQDPDHPPDYTIPLDELRKAELRQGRPNLHWPAPYKGVFDHTTRGGIEEDEVLDIDPGLKVYYTTDLENMDKCFDEFDFPEAKLYLAACKILGIVPVTYFMRSLKGTEIKMNYHSIGVLSMRAICTALKINNTVASLNLAHNNIGPQGVLYLDTLFTNNFMLKHLDLSYNRLMDDGARTCFSLLNNVDTITHLNLAGNNIHDRSASHLASALISNYRISHLDLSHNKLGERAGPAYQKAMKNNESLEVLDLSWNRFRGLAAVSLFRGLGLNLDLVELYMSYNGIGNKGAAALARCLNKNETLTKVDITCNRIGAVGAKSLAGAFKKNATLKELLIGKNPLTPVGALLLLVAAHRPTCALELLDMEDVCVNEDFVTTLDNVRASVNAPGDAGDGAGAEPARRVEVKVGAVYGKKLNPLRERQPPPKPRKKKGKGKKGKKK